MELLQKFKAVEVQTDRRITEMDREYCSLHQEAYEAAIGSFQELAFFWEDMIKAQQKLLGDSKSPFYHNYLVSHDGPSISRQLINRHIEALHIDFIMTLTRHFNSTYHVSVDSSEVSGALLPKRPEGCPRSERLKLEEAYHAQMRTLTVQYEDVVDQIILRLDGRSFSEQAFYELYTKCHKAAWNVSTQKPEFTRKKDMLCFADHFCRFRGWPYDGWEVYDGMKEILCGLAHYETDSYRVLPLGFSDLPGYRDIQESVTEFPSCEKVKQIKLFKNGRIDFKFHSPEYAEQFINRYLGSAY